MPRSPTTVSSNRYEARVGSELAGFAAYGLSEGLITFTTLLPLGPFIQRWINRPRATPIWD